MDFLIRRPLWKSSTMVKTHFDPLFTLHPMDFGCKKTTLTRNLRNNLPMSFKPLQNPQFGALTYLATRYLRHFNVVQNVVPKMQQAKNAVFMHFLIRRPLRKRSSPRNASDTT